MHRSISEHSERTARATVATFTFHAPELTVPQANSAEEVLVLARPIHKAEVSSSLVSNSISFEIGSKTFHSIYLATRSQSVSHQY